MMDRAVLLRNFNALEPLRKTLRHVLLKETLLGNAAMVALHRDRPTTQVRQHHRRDHLVVRGELALRDPVSGKQDLFRMSDHETTASSRGRRRLPCEVHSIK